MKKRVKVGSDGSVPLEGEVPQSDDASNTSTQSPVKEQEEAPEVPEGMQTLFCFFHSELVVEISCLWVMGFGFFTSAFYFLDRRGQ